MKNLIQKISSELKTVGKIAGVIVPLALAGCNSVQDNRSPKNGPGGSTFITTSENVSIEPYYEDDHMFLDGIVVTKSAYGNGLSIDNIEESTIYFKGSPEYEALRPLLTVEYSQ